VSASEGFAQRLREIGVSAIAAGVGLVALGGVVAGSPAQAASGGNNNAGDVWLDNAGQPPGPGHEMDPHLACADIILWGSDLADPSGSFTIDGWPPSGSGAGNQAWPGTAKSPGSAMWKYSLGKNGGTQDILTNDGFSVAGPGGMTPAQPWAIPVKTLIANARANGDMPQPQQGFHFKLQFSQDPQKHKTFWVNCQVAATSSTTSPATSSHASQSSTSSASPAGAVSGISTSSGQSSGQQATATSRSTTSSGGTGAVSAASATTPNTGTGAAVTTPRTGVALPLGLGLALIGGGLGALAIRRRMGGHGS